MPGHAFAQNPPAPRDVVLHDHLHSVTGDRVRILVAHQGATARPLHLCLHVPKGLKAAKGISHDQHVAPTWWVMPGDTMCQDYAPAVHRLYLWVTDDKGPHPVLSRGLDLRPLANGLVWIEWLDEAF